MARDSFATFVPLSVESDARTKIIFDFFDLLSAIAAHGKSNGLGGRKLSRLAGWWAFEHVDAGNGFEGGYKTWEAAADATSHLFFAYLRSLAPESSAGLNGISTLPMSLLKLVQETEYPPEKPSLLQTQTLRVAMIVESVSPTPFALLRRTNHFQYRDEDYALQQFSEYQDPVKALTEECKRVLKSISAANQSAHISSNKGSRGQPDATWSRFEDIGFALSFDADEDEDGRSGLTKSQGLRTTPASRTLDMGRPTTPSWADFLSSGFVDEAQNNPAPLLLPPDKILPPIETGVRGRSSQSHKPRLESEANLEPGELASISRFDLDEAFWWVWISSLAGEEPAERKAAFGRCALVETVIRGGRWLVMEEMVKGAAPEPVEGAYIAEKKGFFSWTRRGKNANSARRRSTGKHETRNARPDFKSSQSVGASKTSIGPDQHARIQAAAAQLQERQLQQEQLSSRRGRKDVDAASQKTSSVFTLQPVIMSEASPAMKWANKYDKDAIREAYLANTTTGRGLGQATMQSNGDGQLEARSTVNRTPSANSARDLPKLPQESSDDVRPAVPQKPASPPPAPMPPTPSTRDERQILLSEKAAEVELPLDSHPIERKAVPVKMSPSVTNLENGNRVITPEPTIELSKIQSQDRHNKLQKKPTNGGGGFRKIFGRKKSYAPAPTNVITEKAQPGQLQPGGATLGRRFSGFRKKSPVVSPSSPNHQNLVSSPPIQEDDLTPVQSPEPGQPRSYEPSTRTSLSRVDTNDEQEAHKEFSRFDQGPLDDQPAFVGESPETSPRHSEDEHPVRDIPSDTAAEESQGEVLTKTISPAQDRWAQIRKNAAERAAQRQSEEQSRGGQSVATDGDGETSGEESMFTLTYDSSKAVTNTCIAIESRVARIKQRVAELTGNMETGGPSPPNGRRVGA